MSLPLNIQEGGNLQPFAEAIKSFVISPLDNGGKDNGPTPTELFISSLGICIGVYIEGFCKRGGVPYEGMEIKVKWEKSKNPYIISKIDIDVKMPEEILEERKKAVLKVAEHCLIHNTITNHPEIEIKLQ